MESKACDSEVESTTANEQADGERRLEELPTCKKKLGSARNNAGKAKQIADVNTFLVKKKVADCLFRMKYQERNSWCNKTRASEDNGTIGG
ncbi:hypothetical protein PFISCL1PPCAC_20158, partial [Pristionchus fissidentatus]